MSKKTKYAGIWDLPSPLIREILVNDAEVSFEKLVELYKSDDNYSSVIESCVCVVTNDVEFPYNVLLEIEGLESSKFDCYSVDHVTNRSLKKYCYTFLVISAHKECRNMDVCMKLFENIPSKVIWFTKEFRKRAMFYQGNKYHKALLSPPSGLFNCFTGKMKSCEGWVSFVFDNDQEVNVGDTSSTFRVDNIVEITIHNTASHHWYYMSDLKLPKLRHMGIYSLNCPEEELIYEAEDSSEFLDIQTANKWVYSPPSQCYRIIFQNCQFPAIKNIMFDNSTKLEAIKDCEFPKLETLSCNNNFYLLIQNTNLENLKIFTIKSTINCSEIFRENLSYSSESFILDLEDGFHKFCSMHYISRDRIKRFPALILDNTKLSSLETFKIPDISYLLTAGFEKEKLEDLDVQILK
ncbi:hypothetical protein BN7_3863 [Wickerhamomyces ciferrii]|uniref:Uncharacterized protein n=1 Tax=Wickerhamomyces ciferrii (strain ATCC 14091 / BCRC 22168 / CBS 111 / JCM 3599 / NBRC 0793 / NRRL Y-1031 F-60-10) TaxID=1206466 RepID=K0KMX7_WICCF|nr:uncharacterized protein BN7_3863 [Wickerhamomyces ciferrii]CCH44301.1 hypothetical protein BN7_3863 [Wickerhamomyces ciferrii]